MFDARLFPRPTPHVPRTLLVAALLLLSTGCTTVDRAVAVVPWFTTMRDQIGPRPFEAGMPGDSAPRFLAPEGSIPTRGLEDSLDIYGAGLAAVDAMKAPAFETADLQRGRLIYNTYCSVCHGTQGGGDGTVAVRLGYVPALTQEMTRQRSDGYLYAVIRHGRGLMPRYGDKIRDPRDRWLVVAYVRQLQQQGAAR